MADVVANLCVDLTGLRDAQRLVQYDFWLYLGGGGGGLIERLALTQSQVAQWVKNLPAVLEMKQTWVRSLGQEDPLEEGMATHSSILAWRIPWTEEPGGLQSMRSQRIRYDWSNWACIHAADGVKIALITAGGVI